MTRWIGLGRVDAAQIIVIVHFRPSLVRIVARTFRHLQLFIGTHTLVSWLLHLLYVCRYVGHAERVLSFLLLFHPLVLETANHASHLGELIILVLHEIIIIYNSG